MIAPQAFATLAPLPRQADGRRFTLDGDDGLERRLAQACARALSGVRGLVPERRLEALLLGGGYGRGEGGVRVTPVGDEPYNDLEFYVAIRGSRLVNEARYRPGLAALAHILARQSGVEIEFKITSRRHLASSGPSMYLYDLLAGHRRLWGPPDCLTGCDRHALPRRLPVAEATRLLMNRATGLLLARCRLEGESSDEESIDFVHRNIAKAELACGDALLTACGRYHWSCRERRRRLEEIASGRDRRPFLPLAEAGGLGWTRLGAPLPTSRWLTRLTEHHAAGVRFKLHPGACPEDRPALARRHAEVTQLTLETWLWVESRRLGTSFLSARSYAEHPSDKWPEGSRLRNLALNLRAGPRPSLFHASGPPLWRHPRGRALAALALLLWERPSLAESTLQEKLVRWLGPGAQSYSGALAAYLGLWRRVQ